MSSITRYPAQSPEAAAMKKLLKHDEAITRWTKKEDGPQTDTEVTLIDVASDNKRLNNQLLEHTEVIPCAYLTLLFSTTGFPKEYPFERFIKFVKEQTALISKVRNIYLLKKWLKSGETQLSADEALRSFIGGLNLSMRRTPMKKSELHKAMSVFLLTHPRTLSWSDIYDIHDRDVRKAIARPASTTTGLKFRADAKPLKKAAKTDNLYPDRSPWKTLKKITQYGNSIGWSTDKTTSEYTRNTSDSFDMTQQRKLMRHYVGPRFTYIIDYMMAGKYPYLIAINMNTRKAYAILPCLVQKTGLKHYYVPPKFQPKAEECNRDIGELIKQTPVKHLIMDGQSGWDSHSTRAYLDNLGITYKYVDKYDINDGDAFQTQEHHRSNHNTSIVDRLMRTLRMMNYNLGNRNEIEPEVMQWLINEYNGSPHGTLSNLLGRDVSPNDVDGNLELETEIVKRIRAMNFAVTTSPEYALNKYVRVYNQANAMDKVKPKLLPGKWEVVERVDGLFKLRQNDDEIMVPRWMLKNIYG